MKIYSADGQEQSADWLTDNYGPVIAEHAPADLSAYRVVRIDENKTGQTAVKIRVLDERGSPSDSAVAFAWKDAPQQQEGCATQPTDNFIVQYPEGGYTSFAYGKDVYYLPPGNGYHRLWICRPGVPGVSGTPSDVVFGGMLAGTNHWHLDFVFQLTEGYPQYSTLEDALRGEAERNDAIPINPDGALTKAIRAANPPGHLIWQTSDEFTVEDPADPGVFYQAARARDVATNWVHVYYFPLGHYDPSLLRTHSYVIEPVGDT